jgi:hypothetical protein
VSVQISAETETQTETVARIDEDEVVKAPLPPAFVAGLAEALQEVVWQWLHEHAPADLLEVTWFAGEFDHYAREAERRGGRVPADLAKQIPQDLPTVLEALEAHGGNLRAVAMIRGGAV